MVSARLAVFALLLVVVSTLPAAAPQGDDDDEDPIIDLQELLLMVANSLTAFGKVMTKQTEDIKTTLENFKTITLELKTAVGKVDKASTSIGTAGDDIKVGFEKSAATLDTFGKTMTGHFDKSFGMINAFRNLLNDHLRKSSTSLDTFGGSIEKQNKQTSASLTTFGQVIEKYFKNSGQTCSISGADLDDLKATLAEVKKQTGSISTSVQGLKEQGQGSTDSIKVLVEDHKEIKNALANFKGTIDNISILSRDIKNNVGTCSSSITEFIKEQQIIKDKVTQGFQVIDNKIETSCSKKGDKDNEDDKDENGEKPLAVRDCAEVYKKYGFRTSGTYNIRPVGAKKSFVVRCDMDTDGGGWTVIQRRGDYGLPKDYFYRLWDEYKTGFGDMDKEFWLGNDKISTMTLQGNYQLRVDMWDMDNTNAFAKYNTFRVDNEATKYKLTVIGYQGDAGDSLSHHNGMLFSTKDRDNDESRDTHCAADFNRGAWWYKDCYSSNLNGLNLRGRNNQDGHGIEWFRWKGSGYSLPAVEMKIRPRGFFF